MSGPNKYMLKLFSELQNWREWNRVDGFSSVGGLLGHDVAIHLLQLDNAIYQIGADFRTMVDREVRRSNGEEVEPLDPRMLDRVTSTMEKFNAVRVKYFENK